RDGRAPRRRRVGPRGVPPRGFRAGPVPPPRPARAGANEAAAVGGPMNVDLVIAGSGFFGLTIAERCATDLGLRVLIVERRRHIGGNAHNEGGAQTRVGVPPHRAPPFPTPHTQGWGYAHPVPPLPRLPHPGVPRYQGPGCP